MRSVLLLSEGRGDHCHDESFVWKEESNDKKKKKKKKEKSIVKKGREVVKIY